MKLILAGINPLGTFDLSVDLPRFSPATHERNVVAELSRRLRQHKEQRSNPGEKCLDRKEVQSAIGDNWNSGTVAVLHSASDRVRPLAGSRV